MIKGQELFNFIDKRVGVTKDGEQYLSINVIAKDNRKFNFITKNPDVIDKLAGINIQRFSQIKLLFDFDRVYNRERKTSYWTCELLGVD